LEQMEGEVEKLKAKNSKLEILASSDGSSSYHKGLKPSPNRSKSPSVSSVKRNLTDITRENFNLKSKITALETEVKSLTYHREKILQ
jgi:hypothetical protein